FLHVHPYASVAMHGVSIHCVKQRRKKKRRVMVHPLRKQMLRHTAGTCTGRSLAAKRGRTPQRRADMWARAENAACGGKPHRRGRANHRREIATLETTQREAIRPGAAQEHLGEVKAPTPASMSRKHTPSSIVTDRFADCESIEGLSARRDTA